MKVRLNVTGDRELSAQLARMGPAGVTVAKRVLGRLAQRAAEAARPRTPVDQVDGGQLRASVRATRPTRGPAGVSAGVAAGGGDTDSYAVLQHEDLTFKHDDGQAKFIEVSVFEVAPLVPGEVQAELDSALR